MKVFAAFLMMCAVSGQVTGLVVDAPLQLSIVWLTVAIVGAGLYRGRSKPDGAKP